MRQLDWKRAKKICEKYSECEVSAGLAEDWWWTGDVIFENGKRVKNDAYVASSWATPVVSVELEEGRLEIPCWIDGDNAEMPEWWCNGRSL